MSILYIRDKNGNFVQMPSAPGKSAYKIAVERGVFSGTEQEFAEMQVINNKEIIDQITQENIDNWNNMVNNHENLDLSSYITKDYLKEHLELSLNGNVLSLLFDSVTISSVVINNNSGENGDSGDSGNSGENEDIVKTYSITNNLNNVSTNNSITQVNDGDSYTSILTPDDGYEIDSVIVTMNGVDITSSVCTDFNEEEEDINE